MKEKVHEEIIDRTRYEFYRAMLYTFNCRKNEIYYLYCYIFLLKGSRDRKRPRLEKGQEAIDTDIKKEEDIKSEPKGNCT